VSRPIIEVRNLSKKYRLGAIGATSIREQAARVWDRIRGVPHPDPKEYWALRDVSFDIQPGEVVGVIGRNGAGKSTLLKILSRITEPTSGNARIRGRVASLLEVGTGFHPELTGRENVYLNGAILGMTRAEVKSKFDEIVAFAEIDQFIDTPVKRYSSGMYVRLAFAVAAHLEPEILIVDEVLAVGDAQFQRKCLTKVKDVSSSHGRTVIIVSHTLESVAHLCARSLLLRTGNLVHDGSTQSAFDLYHQEAVPTRGLHGNRSLCSGITLEGIALIPDRAASGSQLEFEITVRATLETTLTDLAVILVNQFSQRVAIIDLRSESGPRKLAAGAILSCAGRVRNLPLVPGPYDVGLTVRTSGDQHDANGIARFELPPPAATPARDPYAAQYQGTCVLDYEFRDRVNLK
jgi:lipopolysaccharide transport system ATP-binding protein